MLVSMVFQLIIKTQIIQTDNITDKAHILKYYITIAICNNNDSTSTTPNTIQHFVIEGSGQNACFLMVFPLASDLCYLGASKKQPAFGRFEAQIVKKY